MAIEQRYVEAPVTWVGYQWDWDKESCRDWVNNHGSLNEKR